jgi:hypothetical protein
MIPTVLRSGSSVKVQVDSNTVLPCPSKSLYDIPIAGSQSSVSRRSRYCFAVTSSNSLPSDSLQERFSVPSFQSPEPDRQSDPVQTSRSDLHEILLGDEGSVMVLHGGGELVTHVDGKGILVYGGSGGTIGESFIKTWNDKGFGDKPSSL